MSYKKMFLFLGSILVLLIGMLCTSTAITSFIYSTTTEIRSFITQGIVNTIFAVPLLVLGIIIIVNSIKAFKQKIDLKIPSILLIICAGIIAFRLIYESVYLGQNIKSYYDTYCNPYVQSRSEDSMKEGIRFFVCYTIAATINYLVKLIETGLVILFAILTLVKKDINQEIVENKAPKKGKKSNPENTLVRIKELKELLDSGAITEDEFKELKEKELSNY